MTQKKSPMGLPSDGVIVLPAPKGKGTVEYPYLEPTPEQLAIFAVEATGRDMFGRMGAVLNLLEDIMANPMHAYTLRERLRDRNDQLDFATLLGKVTEVFEAFTGFPTQQPSGSGNSPSTAGRRSTGKVQPGE